MSRKFKKQTHRAKERYEQAVPRFRWMIDACENVRADNATWPAHVYVAIDAVEQEAGRQLARGGVLNQFLELSNQQQINMFAAGLMWATWRMTKGIYRFDSDVYQAVINTKSNLAIPAAMLRRLPEWCVYIETPSLSCDFGMGDTELHGVFVTFSMKAGREFLMIYADTDSEHFDDIMPPSIHIDTMAETLDAGIRFAMEDSQAKNEVLAKKLESWLMPVMNLLLYLCADREVTHKNKVLEPTNPMPKKTKKGWRLFQAQGIKKWDVGVRLGSALRVAQSQQSNESADGSKKRPHLRRAHWHTFVSGKRLREDGTAIPANERNRHIKWVPPIAINVDDIDELPAIIKPVKNET